MPGGEHRSTPIPLNLTTAVMPVRDGTAWLSEARAPWPFMPYLRVHAGDVELSMSADHAAPVIDALSALLVSTTPPGGDPMNRTRTDKVLLTLTASFVGGLAFVAGAISFSHMRELALDHDQFGWKSLAFPPRTSR